MTVICQLGTKFCLLIRVAVISEAIVKGEIYIRKAWKNLEPQAPVCCMQVTVISLTLQPGTTECAFKWISVIKHDFLEKRSVDDLILCIWLSRSDWAWRYSHLMPISLRPWRYKNPTVLMLLLHPFFIRTPFYGQALMFIFFKQFKPKNVPRGFLAISTYIYDIYYKNIEIK